ncbi:MAG: protein arginine kinase [Phycisphaerales bacterium]
MNADWLGSTDAVRAGAHWLTGHGPENDVVISSRVRLARNIEGFPFVCRADTQARTRLLAHAKAALLSVQLNEQCAWVDVHALGGVDRTLLVERHLISKEHGKGDEPRGLLVSIPDERLSIMVNEEDHLRVQVVLPGLSLGEAYRQIDAADDRIESALDYAFCPRFGYLTACPTNVGTAIRCSAMLHLPALKITGEVDKVKLAARDMGLAVRGFYGEGSDAIGDFYQISNQTTLGKPEAKLLAELDRDILPQVLQYERLARKNLMEKRRKLLEDRVFRALGSLRSARLLPPEEALAHLSLVRLGILCGLITDVVEQTVAQLVVQTQPAHLQRMLGRELDQQQRREARADVVRHMLKGV